MRRQFEPVNVDAKDVAESKNAAAARKHSKTQTDSDKYKKTQPEGKYINWERKTLALILPSTMEKNAKGCTMDFSLGV